MWILILKIFTKCKHSKTYNILQNFTMLKSLVKNAFFFLAIRIFHQIQRKKKCIELNYGTYKHLALGWFGQVCVVHAFSKHPILEQAKDKRAKNVHTKYLHLPSLITSILFLRRLMVSYSSIETAKPKSTRLVYKLVATYSYLT